MYPPGASLQPSLMEPSSISIAEDSDDSDALFLRMDVILIPQPVGIGTRLGCGFCKNPGYSNAYAGMPPILTKKPRNGSAGVN